MVKKTQRNQQLGFVYNDDYLDEIIDTLDPYPKLLPNEEAQIQDSEDEYYIVEKILDRKKEGKKFLYKVKWEGYPETSCTWEPLSNLQNVKEMVKEFDRQQDFSNLNLQSTNLTNQGVPSQNLNLPIPSSDLNQIAAESKAIKKQPKLGGPRGRPKKQGLSSQLNPNQDQSFCDPVNPLITEQKYQQLLQEQHKVEQEIKQMLLMRQTQALQQHQQQFQQQQQAIQQQQQQIQKSLPQQLPQIEDAQVTSKTKIKQFFTQRNKESAKQQPQPTQIQPQPLQQPVIEEKKVVQSEQQLVKEPQKRGPKKRGPKNKQVEEEKKQQVQQQVPNQDNLSFSEQLDIASVEQALLPETGSFETDVAKKICGAKLSGNAIYVTVEWETRPNGFKPENSIFTNEQIKEKCPRILVDFYESRINFKCKPSQPLQQPGNEC